MPEASATGADRTQSLGMPARDFTSHQLREARAQAVSLASKNERLVAALGTARERITELGQQLDAVTRPPVTLGLLTALPSTRDEGNVGGAGQEREVAVSLSGRQMLLHVHPAVDDADLQVGRLVAVNDQMLVVTTLPEPQTGEAVTLEETLDDARVLVTTGAGGTRILTLSSALRRIAGTGEGLKPGDTLAADLRADIATALIERTSVEQLVVAEAPDVSWADIGGLGPQIEQIRDALELPFTHPELFQAYGLRAPKGLLLYGPPGCGKTLIAKAVATSLAGSGDAPGSKGRPAAFLNIKGPELLSKFVGETERQIRAIFDQARKAAAEDRPVVIFFDEMEALFRTRGTGVSSDVETMIVPQVLAEIDGVESLRNVVIIGASNREDMIDPAILRPGRLDVKIRINRPDETGAEEILARHLRADLPLAPAELAAHGGDHEATAAFLRHVVVETLYARNEATAVLEITEARAAGVTTRTLHLADLASGAMLAAIISRAKTASIKDELAGGQGGLSADRLRSAVEIEARQNEEITGATTPEGWARLIGARASQIRSVRRLGKESL
ncbi:proteasome ATPase [Actinomyces sp. ZJ308]|uniref:proteasome ATPase n=1 Tax=Actinomyces sp. ZJ308 TaxID=2708342 RepID=UPI001421DF0E|nr:proteasome ATPase [Actinomyces sp. ZJ308]